MDSQAKIAIGDLTFKGFATIVLLIGGVVGYLEYREKNRRELNSMLYKTQMEIYLDATDTTAKFAQASTQEQASQARDHFWELYYGKLSIVENEDVKQSMITFGKGIRVWEDATAPPNSFIPPQKLTLPNEGFENTQRTFKDLSYKLTQKCRESLRRVFHEELSPLGEKKP